MGGAVVLGCSGAGGASMLALTVLQITEVLALSELSADINILLGWGFINTFQGQYFWNIYLKKF